MKSNLYFELIVGYEQAILSEDENRKKFYYQQLYRRGYVREANFLQSLYFDILHTLMEERFQRRELWLSEQGWLGDVLFDEVGDEYINVEGEEGLDKKYLPNAIQTNTPLTSVLISLY